MQIIILILLLIGFIVGLCWLVVNHLRVKYMITQFKKCNVIVFGKKGTGKDLIFQKVINSRKQVYYSNVDYGGKFNNCIVEDLRTGNTYENFIKGNINIVTKDNAREGHDTYLSDCGIILPSQYDSKLHQIFPEFSGFYALSRHLYNSNVHANTQALSRVWKALREQADYYVRCKRTFRFFGFLITEVVTYDRYSSAEKLIEPWKRPTGLNSKDAKARYDEFVSTNGEIQKFYVFNKIRQIKYDTRAYHKIVFGYKYEKIGSVKYARGSKLLFRKLFSRRCKKNVR